MDSRDAPPQQPPPQQPNMMVGPNSYPSPMANPNPNNTATATANSNNNNSSAAMLGGGGPNSGRFQFNTVAQQQPASKPQPLDSMSPSPFDGSLRPCGGGGGSAGFSIDSSTASAGKKKRGRPRKYSPDGNIALGLAPTQIPASAPVAAAAGPHGESSGTMSSDPPAKKNRGRPPGSGKKQLDALGAGGVGFTPHVIMVQAGEDIASKVMSFSQQGPRTVCILSANGPIGNVTLRQPSMSGGTVTYEGRFEIISLSGSYLFSENNGNRSRTGGLSVSLAGSDGSVLGGGVAGMLLAAGPVQVIVGSFIAEGKKSSSNLLKSGPSSPPPSQMLNFGAPMTAASPSSQGGGSTESSDENGSSPLNKAPPVLYSNPSQPMHNITMYQQLWAGQTQQ
ncbi:putative PPC domain, AT hook, DNA-binding protein [Rosa chinensis]|uniref:AT-hook motif nuclear-localized protein n=1 Tax=Rosa chinensis TaxID=74649 RepID=A0A2P6P9Y9_ROSCH|nr:AT-hook motif nuclear-localized protein 8 [Rosa chinensis]PRQ18751.1 putative PPC domain, AT hook, DNA-binding protein [Rosa chinensis]